MMIPNNAIKRVTSKNKVDSLHKVKYFCYRSMYSSCTMKFQGMKIIIKHNLVGYFYIEYKIF